jgi:hypothetical protein
MASRAELIQIAKELDIEYKGLLTDEMDKVVREAIDKQFNIPIMIGDTGKSETLLRFMSEEFDYKFYNEDGKEVDYLGKLK